MSKKIKSNSSRPPLLHMQAASVVKGGKRVLDGLSLEIREGEHTAILGPNGAGKSSFIRLITREDYPLAPDNGAPPLTIFGQDLWNVFELRSHLGIISADLQAAFLNRTLPGRTRGLDAVLSGFFASYGVFPHHHVTDAMRVKPAGPDAAGSRPGRCLHRECPGKSGDRPGPDHRAVILDEPTTGLDLVARSRFLDAESRPARQDHYPGDPPGGRDLPEIDRVILLQHGRILLDGRSGRCTSQDWTFGAPARWEHGITRTSGAS